MIPPVEKIPVLIRVLLLGRVYTKRGGPRAGVREAGERAEFFSEQKSRSANGFGRKT